MVTTSTKRRTAVGANTARSDELCVARLRTTASAGIDRREPGEGGHESPRSVLERTLAHSRQDGGGHDEQDRARDRGDHSSRGVERAFRLASLRIRAPRCTEDEGDLKGCDTHHHDGGGAGRETGSMRSDCNARATARCLPDQGTSGRESGAWASAHECPPSWAGRVQRCFELTGRTPRRPLRASGNST